MKTKNFFKKMRSFLLWSFLVSIPAITFAAVSITLISTGLNIDNYGVLGFVVYLFAFVMVISCASSVVIIFDHIKNEVL